MNFEPGIIQKVATILMGEPNAQLSNECEIRYGTYGSLSIAIDKNTFYDHESNIGGGILDLIKLKTGLDQNVKAVDWIKEHGISPSDTPQKQEKIKRHLVASYNYKDEAGVLLYQVHRFEPKQFVQRRPNGDAWEYKVKGTRKVPYRLPELLEAPVNKPVYIVEGEKDVDRLMELGLVATCNSGGAGKWDKNFAEYLTERTVICIPDNDPAGRDHAQKVAQSLRHDTSIKVRILELPNLPEKGDVSDWLEAGGVIPPKIHRF